MTTTDFYPTQEQLNKLGAEWQTATFDREHGRWILRDGRAIPCCEGCGSWPTVVAPTEYPDPMGAPSQTVNHYLCGYHAESSSTYQGD